VPAHALWLIWITERLDSSSSSSSSSIAEVAKRKANLVGTWESNIPLILLLPIFVVTVLHQKTVYLLRLFFLFSN
jgi:hypothetical protein